MRFDGRWLLSGLGLGALIGLLTPAVLLSVALTGEMAGDGLLAFVGSLVVVSATFGLVGLVIGAVLGALVGGGLAVLMPRVSTRRRRGWVAATAILVLFALEAVVVGALGDGVVQMFTQQWVWLLPGVMGAALGGLLTSKIESSRSPEQVMAEAHS